MSYNNQMTRTYILILIHSICNSIACSTRKVDRIGMRRSKKSCAARPLEAGRHAVSKFRRAVNMKIAVEDR